MSARVKKLVWRDGTWNVNKPQFVARSVFGGYVAYMGYRGNWVSLFADGSKYSEPLATKDEAQSACQSHYEKAVMALLETTQEDEE